MMGIRYEAIHQERLGILKSILEASDIILNALRVDDIDILESMLAEKESLIEEHERLVALNPGYAEHPAFFGEDIKVVLQALAALDGEITQEYHAMKSRVEEQYNAFRRQSGELNRKIAVDNAYTILSRGLDHVRFDLKK